MAETTTAPVTNLQVPPQMANGETVTNGETKAKKPKPVAFESFYTDEAKLHEAAEKSKAAGNKALIREAVVDIDGRKLFILCYNPDDALLRAVKHVTLEKMGIKVEMKNEAPKASVAKIVTADSLLAAMANLPEAERLKVQAALKSAKPVAAPKK